MPSLIDDEYSDSDDEQVSDVETSVLLGVPDGPIDVPAELGDAAVSRIGGHPAFLPSAEPSFASSHCKVCSKPMELLVQIWCPFEDSPMDRALYIWGCARGGCQRKDGSIRAWRGLRYNGKYAVKLEQKLARRRDKEKAQAAARAEQERVKAAAKSNPFSMSNAAAPNPFGLGAQIFGGSNPAPAPEPESRVEEDEEEEGEEEDVSDTESEKSLLTAMASTTLSESAWKAAPLYPPLYLSTSSEYLPPQPKLKLPPGAQISDPLEDDNGGKKGKDKDISWASEAYENSLELDHVFERFMKRVDYEGEQCVRYELKGTPLPFSSDHVFQALFPAPPVEPLPVTKPAFKVVHTPKRTYKPAGVPPCPTCHSPRVFECQLMPNLINILRASDADKGKVSDEERRKAVKRALKGLDSDEKRGMEWGTCMIFSCEKDCCVEGGTDLKEAWREEVVYVQWDV
ncbi:programmed cell death protein 2 [Infundibulicybe gibba]|nr:programmed cell death protein 2 [Infundibulicybe gibba]